MAEITVMSSASKAGRARDAPPGKEWEAKRAQFISGKRCEWCGAGEGLAVAMRVPLPPYISQLKEASARLLKDRIDAGEFFEIEEALKLCPQCGSSSFATRKHKMPALKCRNCRAEFDSPEERVAKTGRIPPEQWKAFWEKYSPAIKDGIMAERGKAEEAYRSLTDCIVLCKRCHFARQKGMTLCPACGKGYRRAGNELCWECFKKTPKGMEVAKMYELVAYEHPWCKRKFGIERRFLELLSDPAICCQELCSDASGCGVLKSRQD